MQVMYFVLKKGILKSIVEKAAKKAGSMQELTRITKIAKSNLYIYKAETRPIKDKKLDILLSITEDSIKEKEIKEILPDNYKQIKGGKNCVKSKKKNGTFEKQIRRARKGASKQLKKWHHDMKINHPEEYYNKQYSRFKKIAGYKFITLNGEKVRNSFERDVANILSKFKIKYEYEPLINKGDRYFFPDFLINNKIIIECTMWRGTDKAIKLAKKIEALKGKYEIYVVIPKALNKYYQIVNNHLVLGLDEFVPLAQTFRDHKRSEREQQVEHLTVTS